MAQTLIWSWQEAKNVTDAFDQTRGICNDLKLSRTIVTYTAFMNALTRYRELFHDRLRDQFQMLAEDVAGERFSTHGWVLIGFDGSRILAPRTQSSERPFGAPNYGKGHEAKYGKKKLKGMRRCVPCESVCVNCIGSPKSMRGCCNRCLGPLSSATITAPKNELATVQ